MKYKCASIDVSSGFSSGFSIDIISVSRTVLTRWRPATPLLELASTSAASNKKITLNIANAQLASAVFFKNIALLTRSRFYILVFGVGIVSQGQEVSQSKESYSQPTRLGLAPSMFSNVPRFSKILHGPTVFSTFMTMHNSVAAPSTLFSTSLV